MLGFRSSLHSSLNMNCLTTWPITFLTLTLEKELICFNSHQVVPHPIWLSWSSHVMGCWQACPTLCQHLDCQSQQIPIQGCLSPCQDYQCGQDPWPWIWCWVLPVWCQVGLSFWWPTHFHIHIHIHIMPMHARGCQCQCWQLTLVCCWWAIKFGIRIRISCWHRCSSARASPTAIVIPGIILSLLTLSMGGIYVWISYDYELVSL